MDTTASQLEARVTTAAGAALERGGSVSVIDVLLGLGWLTWSHVERWQQGRIDCLEDGLQVGAAKLDRALATFEAWARDRGLEPHVTEYLARTRDRRVMRCTLSGDPARERVYQTQWLSPALPPRERERRVERARKAPDLVVISPLKDWTCSACGGTGEWLIMEGEGPLCLTCADMDHLVFLPSGDAALTRRAKRASTLSAVVVRFSRARKRYERQGLLVEEEALEAAEVECLADEELRARRRERDAARRAAADVGLQAEMARRILAVFPGCPPERAEAVARHAAARGSGRVGRSAAGRALEPRALELALATSVRHQDTPYDELLMTGVERSEAREQVRDEVARVMRAWTERPPG